RVARASGIARSIAQMRRRLGDIDRRRKQRWRSNRLLAGARCDDRPAERRDGADISAIDESTEETAPGASAPLSPALASQLGGANRFCWHFGRHRIRPKTEYSATAVTRRARLWRRIAGSECKSPDEFGADECAACLQLGEKASVAACQHENFITAHSVSL